MAQAIQKRRGSRTYSTYTYHSKRNPTDIVNSKRVTYRDAIAFLDRWQTMLEESPLGFAKVTRKHNQVEGVTEDGTVLRAYVMENKPKKEE